MKLHVITLCALVAGAPAFAQEASPKPPAASASSRAEVKDEAKAANKAGEIPKGDAGISANHPRGGAAGNDTGNVTTPSPSRAEVKDEAKAANKAGEIPKGEADTKTKP
jgi:hypothetical protein